METASALMVITLALGFMLFGLYIMLGRSASLFGYVLAVTILSTVFEGHAWAQRANALLLNLGIPVIILLLFARAFVRKKP